MSAVAAILTKNEALILSDGLVTNLSGPEIPGGLKVSKGGTLATNCKKIGSVNDHVGIMMTGRICFKMKDVLGFVSSKGSETPQEVSRDLADFLKLAMRENPNYRSQLMDRGVWLLVIGYEKGSPCGYWVSFQGQGGLTIKRSAPSIPYITFQGPLVDKPQRLFKQILNTSGNHAETLMDVGQTAFTCIVRNLESKGHDVGGQIFYETITNPN